MQYLEAINHADISDKLSIFLGGAITGAWDWQQSVVDKLKYTDLIVVNPRRANFPINDPSAAEEQIKWEFDYLNKCRAIMFWFSYETLCPITLFEYGKWINSDKRLFVGCHPSYQRLQDVCIQSRLARPQQQIHIQLSNLTDEILEWYYAQN